MLVNQQGKQVKVSDKFNNKTHPHIFAPLREIKVPMNHSHDAMFRLETRAKMV